MWIIVVEPYFDGSHRAWAEGYQKNSSHDVDLVTHRGSFWKWRMQGSALTLAEEIRSMVERRGRAPGAVVVSDMVDVAALRGLIDRHLGGAPVVAYFHENQLTYPLAPGAIPDLSYGMRNWISMAAADEVWFNSEFHLTEVTRVLPVLLGSMPDHRHLHLLDEVTSRFRIHPVGIELAPTSPPRTAGGSDAPLVLWNQRWEYDKDPSRFFAAMDRLDDAGIPFTLAVCGQNFRNEPAEFSRAAERLGSRLIHFGEADRDEYRQLLTSAALVVSTARHEFFGLAVIEAISAGCLPILPNALVYPEIVGPVHGPICLYENDDQLDALLHKALTEPQDVRAVAADLARSVRERFEWRVVAGDYDERLEELSGLSS